MMLDVRERLLKPESIAFNAEVLGSQGVRRDYAAKSMNDNISLREIIEPGDYRVMTRMFATTLDGREVVVDLAEQRFSVAGTGVDPKEVLASQGIEVESARLQQDGEMQTLVDEVTEEFRQGIVTLKEMNNQPEQGLNWWWVIGLNLLLLFSIVAIVVVFKLRILRVAQRRAMSCSAANDVAKAANKKGGGDSVDLTLP
jgi:hypothetical protein